MVGTYSLSSGITALIKQLSHRRPRGGRIMGKQYPRLGISLLCKSAASLGQRGVTMRRTESAFDSGDRDFGSCQETQTQRGQLEAARAPRPGLKSTFSNVRRSPRRRRSGFFCATRRDGAAAASATEGFCHSLQFNAALKY